MNSYREGHPHSSDNYGNCSQEDNDTVLSKITSKEKLYSCSEGYPPQLVKSATSSFGGAETSIVDPDVTILDSEKIHPLSECPPHPSVSATSSSWNAKSLKAAVDAFLKDKKTPFEFTTYEDSNDGDKDIVVIRECPRCGKKFREKSSFNFHMRRHEKSPKCLRCGKECHDKASFYCRVCVDTSPTQTSDEQDSDDEIQCYDCGKEFPNKASYYPHRKAHESGELPTQSSDE